MWGAVHSFKRDTLFLRAKMLKAVLLQSPLTVRPAL
jgi:hypothetical protein